MSIGDITITLFGLFGILLIFVAPVLLLVAIVQTSVQLGLLGALAAVTGSFVVRVAAGLLR